MTCADSDNNSVSGLAQLCDAAAKLRTTNNDAAADLRATRNNAAADLRTTKNGVAVGFSTIINGVAAGFSLRTTTEPTKGFSPGQSAGSQTRSISEAHRA